jgi:eukaryotic-like serine/threonine-protein kinase
MISPDATRVAFNSNQTGPLRVFVRGLNSGDATPITLGPEDFPASWTANGKELAFVHGNPEAGGSSYDVSVVAVDQPNKIRPLLNDPRFNETHADFSPDGRWLAYVSDISGRREVYVQPYPGPGRPLLISSEGGTAPAWSRNGKELFYLDAMGPTGKMLSVQFRVVGNEFIPEKPIVLFEAEFDRGAVNRNYDVSADGRFLAVQTLPEGTERGRKIFPETLRIVVNWVPELDRIFSR